MYIKSAKAFYGKLDSAQICFKKGLNIVYAPNEAGKTTWCSFFKTMLYGINSQERDKTGFLSVKTKYEPWQGNGMRGSMELNFREKDITLERTALSKAPMRNLSAVYTGTDIHLKELETESCGEILTGVSKSVFEKSAFIESGRLNVSAGAELEHKINALVSSGDEENAMSEADDLLTAAQKKLKSRGNGLIPELRAEISAAEEELTAIKTGNYRIFSLENDIESETEELSLLENEELSHKFLAKKKRYDDVDKYCKELKQIEAEKETAEKEHAEVGYAGKEAAFDIRVRLAHLEEYTEASAIYKQAAAEAKAVYEQHLKSREKFRFKSNTAEGLEAETEDLITAQVNAMSKSASAHKAANIYGITAIVAILLGIIGIISHIWYLCIAFAFSAVMAVLYFKNINKSDEYLKKADDGFKEVGCSSEKELEEQKTEYLSYLSKTDELENNSKHADLAYQSALGVLSDNKADILEAARKITEIDSVEGAADLADRIDRINNTIETLHRRSEMLSSKLAILREHIAEEKEELPEPEKIVTPRFDAEETRQRLSDSRAKLARLQSAYNMEKGRMGVYTDPLLIESKISELTKRLAKAEDDFFTIELAREALAEADTEIQRRFSPIMSQKAGSIFNLLTGGKYDMLAFNKNFDANAVEHGDAVGRNILYMSSGTADQIYLALRLAIAELVLKGEESCPIILDDALICFDDERMAYALDYFKQISADRQIILFSCHKREIKYFANDAEVNTVTL